MPIWKIFVERRREFFKVVSSQVTTRNFPQDETVIDASGGGSAGQVASDSPKSSFVGSLQCRSLDRLFLFGYCLLFVPLDSTTVVVLHYLVKGE